MGNLHRSIARYNGRWRERGTGYLEEASTVRAKHEHRHGLSVSLQNKEGERKRFSLMFKTLKGIERYDSRIDVSLTSL
jgi:hypothetical protein